MLEWSSLKQKAEQIKALRWDSNRQMSDAVAVAVHLQRDVKKVFQCYTYWLLVYFINNGLNFTFYSWNKYRRRKWQPTPVFLPGEFRGQRSPVGYSLWDHKESDTTEWLTHTLTNVSFLSCQFEYNKIPRGYPILMAFNHHILKKKIPCRIVTKKLNV